MLMIIIITILKELNEKKKKKQNWEIWGTLLLPGKKYKIILEFPPKISYNIHCHLLEGIIIPLSLIPSILYEEKYLTNIQWSES